MKDVEVVVGLVTPIGQNTSELASNICGRFSDYNYQPVVIKLSDHLLGEGGPVGEHEDQRVRRLIAAGDEFCRANTNEKHPTGDPAALARLAVREILSTRLKLLRQDGIDTPAKEMSAGRPRTAYILHSLKRPAEIQLLRTIYGEQFILFGSQGTLKDRIDNLLSRSLGSANQGEREAIVQELIDLDADERDDNGQRMNEAYPLADYFLRNNDPRRAIQLLFGEPIAPDIGEFAMYIARASQARSLAASRKVGASIVVGDALVATGYNDAPFGQDPDVVRGDDTSEKFKRENVKDTVTRLKKAGLIKDDGPTDDPPGEQTLTAALQALKGGEQLSIIEYQRAVHAEAKAIDDATVRGVSPVGGTLYVTTFPCHLCYKHALSARLSRVEYIEPYPKSRALSMYPEGANERLIPYEGVAPGRYMEFFDARNPFMSDASGKFVDIDRQVAGPLFSNIGDDADRNEKELVAVLGLKEEYR